MKNNANKRKRLLVVGLWIFLTIGAVSRAVDAQYGNLFSKEVADDVAKGGHLACGLEMRELYEKDRTNAAAQVEEARCIFLAVTNERHRVATKKFLSKGISEADVQDLTEIHFETDRRRIREIIDKVIAEHPKYAPAYYMRGLFDEFNGRKSEAQTDFDLAILLDPQDYHAYVNRGRLKDDAGDAAGAIADYEKVVALGISDPYVAKRLPELKRKTGATARPANKPNDDSAINRTSATPDDYIKRAEKDFRNGKYYEALFNAKKATDPAAAESLAGDSTPASSLDKSGIKSAADKINADVKTAAAPLAFKFWELELKDIRGLDRTDDADKNNAAWRNPNIIGYHVYRGYGDKWNSVGFAVVKGAEKLLELKNWKESEKLRAQQASNKPKVVILNKKTNKYEVWNAVPVQPKIDNLRLTATQNRGSLEPDASIAFSFENTRLNFDQSIIVPPKDFFADQEVIEIYDGEGLAVVERNKLTLLRGDKGIANVMDTEADSGNLREAKQVYLYFMKVTKSLQGLDNVKSRKKLLLAKLYATKNSDLRKFVEEEMTKYNYTEDEKKAVRSK